MSLAFSNSREADEGWYTHEVRTCPRCGYGELFKKTTKKTRFKHKCGEILAHREAERQAAKKILDALISRASDTPTWTLSDEKRRKIIDILLKG